MLYLFAGMLLSVLRSLKSIQAGAERLAKGDASEIGGQLFQRRIAQGWRAVNSVVQTLQKFIKSELEMAVAHNRDGRTSQEMRASDFPGAYGEMAQNLNAMVKGHIDVQSRFTDLMGEYAGGKFERRGWRSFPANARRFSDAAEKVRAGLEANAKAAQYNARVKAALDYVSLPVRIADPDGVILYVNNAFKETLHKYEAGFRRQDAGLRP